MARTDAPAFQWYPADWMRKTRGLSPPAKGVWIDLMSAMWWEDSQCSISGTADKLARICGCSRDELISACDELKTEKICDFQGEFHDGCNGIVTIVSRRMKKDRENREQTRKRVSKHRVLKREKRDSNGHVTRMFDGSSSSSSCTKVHSPLPPEGVEGESFLPEWESLQSLLVATGKCPNLTREMLVSVQHNYPKADLRSDASMQWLREELEGEAGRLRNVVRWLRWKASDLEKKFAEDAVAPVSTSLNAPVDLEGRKRKLDVMRKEMEARNG